jgi:hypothetical protein
MLIFNNFPIGQEEQLLQVTAVLNEEFLYGRFHPFIRHKGP